MPEQQKPEDDQPSHLMLTPGANVLAGSSWFKLSAAFSFGAACWMLHPC